MEILMIFLQPAGAHLLKLWCRRMTFEFMERSRWSPVRWRPRTHSQIVSQFNYPVSILHALRRPQSLQLLSLLP